MSARRKPHTAPSPIEKKPHRSDGAPRIDPARPVAPHEPPHTPGAPIGNPTPIAGGGLPPAKQL